MEVSLPPYRSGRRGAARMAAGYHEGKCKSCARPRPGAAVRPVCIMPTAGRAFVDHIPQYKQPVAAAEFDLIHQPAEKIVIAVYIRNAVVHISIIPYRWEQNQTFAGAGRRLCTDKFTTLRQTAYLFAVVTFCKHEFEVCVVRFLHEFLSAGRAARNTRIARFLRRPFRSDRDRNGIFIW